MPGLGQYEQVIHTGRHKRGIIDFLCLIGRKVMIQDLHESETVRRHKQYSL